MIREQTLAQRLRGPIQNASPCEHRTVSKDGRILCSKIVDGDNEVSPNVCRTCPHRSVNCAHLRFSLRQVSPSPIIVRFNGHTEVWDDDPPEIRFEQAACAAKVMPIAHPRACASCLLRQPIQAAASVAESPRQVAGHVGKVVPFRTGKATALAG